MTVVRRILAPCAFFFAAVGIAACGGGIPGDAVVQVGSAPITKAQFNHWLNIAAISTQAPTTSGSAPKVVVPQPPDYTACIAQKRASSPKPAAGQSAPTDAQFKTQCAAQYTQLKQEVLQYLIRDEWVIGEAADQGVKVTDAQVQKEFTTEKNQQFQTPAAYNSFLQSSGQTQADILFKVRLSLLSRQLQAKVIKSAGTVTTADAQKYYAQNHARYATPETRDLRLIRVSSSAQAQTVLKALHSGQPFAAVAKKYSVDQSKAQGGAVLGVIRGQQVKALDDAVFAAQRGTLTGPIQTPYGFYIFQVQKITPATTQTFAQVESQIKQQLASTRQQTALTTFINKKYTPKWTSRTDCRAGYVVPSCKQAPKTSTTATTAAG